MILAQLTFPADRQIEAAAAVQGDKRRKRIPAKTGYFLPENQTTNFIPSQKTFQVGLL